jgi:hypothetical protein
MAAWRRDAPAPPTFSDGSKRLLQEVVIALRAALATIHDPKVLEVPKGATEEPWH